MIRIVGNTKIGSRNFHDNVWSTRYVLAVGGSVAVGLGVRSCSPTRKPVNIYLTNDFALVVCAFVRGNPYLDQETKYRSIVVWLGMRISHQSMMHQVIDGVKLIWLRVPPADLDDDVRVYHFGLLPCLLENKRGFNQLPWNHRTLRTVALIWPKECNVWFAAQPTSAWLHENIGAFNCDPPKWFIVVVEQTGVVADTLS